MMEINATKTIESTLMEANPTNMNEAEFLGIMEKLRLESPHSFFRLLTDMLLKNSNNPK